MLRFIVGLLSVLALSSFSSCAAQCSPGPAPASSEAGPDVTVPETTPGPDEPVATKAILSNTTDAGAVVNVSFGSDSIIGPSDWSSFCAPIPGGCSVSLPASSGVALPMRGLYTNVSFAFNAPVGCGATVAEFTANDSNGYGTADVSLVNGWNADVAVVVDGQLLGPATSGDMSATMGVYPAFCDICVARASPPCGASPQGCTAPGSCGCKSGTQYNPTVPCQLTYQNAAAGSFIDVELLP